MSFKKKHLEAVNTSSWAQKTANSLAEKIMSDSTGAFWHKEESISYMLKQAKELDEQKEKGALYGVSFGVKDLFTIKGLTTTAGSSMLKNFKAPYTSTLVQDILNHGALMSGRLAMDEFAMGSYSNTSPFGRVSMPGKPEHTAGGSSGGSASAMNVLDFTLGSDTGGSVRQPASFCGYVGYKPSYHAFSRFGMISYASSLDQAGFFTHNVEDLEYLMNLGLSRADERDTTSFGLTKNKVTGSGKIGFFPEILESDLQPDVRMAYARTLERFPKDRLMPIRMKYLKHAIETYYVVACAEASSNLARYQGVYFGEDLDSYEGSYWDKVAQNRSKHFGIEVQKRIMLGSFITSSENFSAIYEKATGVRKALKQEFYEVFEKVGMLVLPVSPFTAPTWDEISQKSSAEIYMGDFMTVPFSLAGLPALSLPIEKSSSGMPIGMQFVGKAMEDFDLISRCRNIL